ncbi:MAG: glycosyltransferase [Gammaproteobacteria bacterium]|nr:glycosyltransferase [Gammaproteobacteria bacterium]
MKIVFFVKRFYTNKDLIKDRFGRLFYFPTILAEMGHDCEVVALDFKNSAAIDMHQDNVRFRTLTKRSFWRLPSAASLCSKLDLSDADVVFSSGDSYCGYLGLRLARHLSAKAVFDIYDDYANFGSNKLPFMRSMLTTAASESDLLVCASESIRDTYSALQANAVMAQNGVDSHVFAPEEKQSARTSAGLGNNEAVVGYFGSIHNLRGIDDLIAAIELLRAEDRDVKLLLAGRDYGDADLKRPWIDYRGMVDQDEVVTLINACDVVTIPYKDTDIIRMTNACKLMEYFACRVPVVVTDVSDYASYFPAQFSCVAKPSDPASLAEAIGNQLENGNVVDAAAVISWEKVTAQLDAQIRRLI